jgi:nucleoside-diphosphate-sugar epimerase
MIKNMHTILGAGGPVATALAQEVENHNEPLTLVSRKPVKTNNPKTTWKKADLLNRDELLRACEGSTVIYLCAGIVYNAKIWQEQWPVIIGNVISATKATGARLIFFDNVYMYGLVNGPMTENTPYNPISEKGKVRMEIANKIMDEVKAGNIRASIARAADFYGTHSSNAFLDMMVLDKYAKKQKAQWMGNPNKKHSFSYIPDMGKAMFLLGQTPGSDNQVWHLPTAPAMTGKQIMHMSAVIYHTKPSYMRVSKLMLQLLGLFNPLIRGTVEMYYQQAYDYIFDSSKFEKAFNFVPTPYEEGIRHSSETLYKPIA